MSKIVQHECTAKRIRAFNTYNQSLDTVYKVSKRPPKLHTYAGNYTREMLSQDPDGFLNVLVRTYDDVPEGFLQQHIRSFLEDLYAAVPQSRKLYIAPSAKDATRLAYTPYISYRQQRQAKQHGATAKPKRFIPKSLATLLVRECGLDEDKARKWQERWALVASPSPDSLGIVFTTDPDEIERVYEDCTAASCIGGKDASRFDSPVHPARIYGDNPDGVALAYYKDSHDQITGRGVCVPSEKKYVRWYGDGEFTMARLGYSRDADCLVGKRFPILGRHDDQDRVVAPYIDGTAEWLIDRSNGDSDDGWLVLEEDRDDACHSYYCQFGTAKQHGWSCVEGTRDYDLGDEDEGIWVETRGGHYDEDEVTYSDYDGEYIHIDDLITVARHTGRRWYEETVHEDNDTTEVQGLDYEVLDNDLSELISDGHIIAVAGDYYTPNHGDIVFCGYEDCYAHYDDTIEVNDERYTKWYIVDSLDEFYIKEGELAYHWSDRYAEGTPLKTVIDQYLARATEDLYAVSYMPSMARYSLDNLINHLRDNMIKPKCRRLGAFIASLGLSPSCLSHYLTKAAHNHPTVVALREQRSNEAARRAA